MQPTDENRRAWDEVHRRRAEVLGADLRLPDVVRRSLAGLAGKRVLHLGSGTGEETIELAGLGATVTAVDPREAAVDAARERAPSVLWVHADPQALPAELRRARYDLAYAGVGSIALLRDLAGWAAGAAAALRRGGDLLLYDEHPVALVVDPFGRWQGDYFGDLWRLGQIVDAVARAGLVVRALEEYPAAARRRADHRAPATFLLHARKGG